MKHFLKSKTIRGLLLAALPMLGLATQDQVLFTQTLDAIITLSGLILAGYGRVKASDKLRFN